MLTLLLSAWSGEGCSWWGCWTRIFGEAQGKHDKGRFGRVGSCNPWIALKAGNSRSAWSFAKCSKSLFAWHPEKANLHTHWGLNQFFILTWRGLVHVKGITKKMFLADWGYQWCDCSAAWLIHKWCNLFRSCFWHEFLETRATFFSTSILVRSTSMVLSAITSYWSLCLLISCFFLRHLFCTNLVFLNVPELNSFHNYAANHC